MTRFVFILLTTFSISTFAASPEPHDSINIGTLGKLDLSYFNVKQVSTVKKTVSSGTVTALPGAALRIVSPMNPQQIDYLVLDGELVQQGQRIAKLSGSEVHHFRDSLQAKRTLRMLAKARFDANKPLIESQSISQGAWFDIAQQYYEADLMWGHLNHFAEMFEPLDHDDKGYLIAAETGVFLLPQTTRIDDGTLLGSILRADAVRLTTLMNRDDVMKATALATDKCKVGIDNIEQVNRRLLVNVWSAPIPTSCELQLGEQVKVSAHLTMDSLEVSAKSVFYLAGQASVFALSGETLKVVPVEVVGQSEGDILLVKTHPSLLGQKVLSSSVSAVQGVLLGLGGIE